MGILGSTCRLRQSVTRCVLIAARNTFYVIKVIGNSSCDPYILSESALLAAVAAARAHGETIVMTNGCFDILHIGHVLYLQKAKALGQRLIVAVNDDDSVRRLKGQDRPLNPLSARMILLAALRDVDWVVSFSEDTPERLIGVVSPDILVKGGDYRGQDIPGAALVKARGGRVEFLEFYPDFSTTQLIARIQTL